MTLLEALTQLAPESSKNTLRSWVKEGRVTVDGNSVTHAALPLVPGQEVAIGQRKKFLESGIEILYEDRDLVVIDKPSGLLSVAAQFDKELTAHALLKAHYRKQVSVVHRLDQDTSGVMLFALNETTADLLKKLFETHAIQRSYSAIVEGVVTTSSGTWKSYLYETPHYVVKETHDSEKGRLAITHYKFLESRGRYSWLELALETGKKNQIRVHCQSAGHPIAGDKKYGAVTNPLKRLCLHAHALSFTHPISKKPFLVQSPVPASFARLFPNRPF